MADVALRIAPCGSDAAKLAVTRWHYSRTMPSGRLVRYGVWEDGSFVGVVLFGRGTGRHLGKRYGLTQTECVELVRIALRAHTTPVSRIVSIALKLLKRSSPGLRLIVSFADPKEGHVGTIYQASGWTFAGTSVSKREYLWKGRWTHDRDLSGSSFGRPPKISREHLHSLPKRIVPGKFRYIFPLDPEMRERIKPLAEPYPKTTTSRGRSIDSDAPATRREKAVQARPGRSKSCRSRETS